VVYFVAKVVPFVAKGGPVLMAKGGIPLMAEIGILYLTIYIVLVNLKKYGKVKGIMIYLIRCSMYIACMICNSKQQFICYRNGGASDVINIWNHCLDFSGHGGAMCCCG